MQIKILLFFTLTSLLTYVYSQSSTTNISYKDKYSRLLNKSYKSDIEYIFDSNFDLHKTPVLTTKESIIRKFFHKFKENEIYLYNGAKMKCYTPSKIRKSIDRNHKNLNQNENKIEKIPEELAVVFLREASKLCYNSNFQNWFYKLCPRKNANQLLTYKKKDEVTGEEYQENWSLGYTNPEINSENINTYSTFIYKKETNDSQSFNIEKNPYVVFDDRIAKIYNYNLPSHLKNDNLNLLIEYPLVELKNLNKTVIVNKNFKGLEDYLITYPDRTVIPVERRILKLINKHLVVLDLPMPTSGFSTKFGLTYGGERKSSEINTSFNLNVFGEYIFCYRCEFMTYYNPGDYLFIKNGLYSDSMKLSFKGTSYKSRRILKIYDNQLLKVEKKFPKDFQGAVLRNNFFVFEYLNSLNEQIERERKFQKLNENNIFSNLIWKKGRGIIYVKGKLILGLNSNFKTELQRGNKIFMYNVNKVQEYFNVANSNPKVIFSDEEMSNCIVDKIISNFLIITVNPCKKPFGHKGDYFIARKSKILKEGIYSQTQNKISTLSPTPTLITSPIEFDTPETLNIMRSSNYFYDKQFLFHEGFLIRNLDSTVFRFKIERGQSNLNSNLRMLLGTELNSFNEKKYKPENDYELVINSESGAMIKKISNYETNNGQSSIEFFDTEIRSFFGEQILINIIIHKGVVYLSTVDEDKESSVKIKFILPNNLKITHLYFDLLQSDNVYLKDIRKINFVELKYLVDIFFYDKKLLLTQNANFTEEMTNGDFCPETKSYRKSVIEYRCDHSGIYDIYIENVKEEKMCEYKYLVRSKFLCNPIDIQMNKIEKSIAKTKCVVQNRNFNYADEVYFRNIEV